MVFRNDVQYIMSGCVFFPISCYRTYIWMMDKTRYFSFLREKNFLELCIISGSIHSFALKKKKKLSYFSILTHIGYKILEWHWYDGLQKGFEKRHEHLLIDSFSFQYHYAIAIINNKSSNAFRNTNVVFFLLNYFYFFYVKYKKANLI